MYKLFPKHERLLSLIFLLAFCILLSYYYFNYYKSESNGKAITETESGDITEGGIHRYSYFIDDCTWEEAFHNAIESNGYLVRINSHKEYEYILSEIKELGYENIQFRIGGRRAENSLHYYWANENNQIYGKQLNDSDYWCTGEWLQDEPSYRHDGYEEMYLEFYYDSNINAWYWNDVPNDSVAAVPDYSGKLGYIVEYED